MQLPRLRRSKLRIAVAARSPDGANRGVELVIVGARVYERADFEQAVELLALGQLPADVLISSVEPFERAEHAFRELEQGRALKILLEP